MAITRRQRIAAGPGRTQPAAPIVAPVVSNVVDVLINPTTAAISWDCDVGATGQVGWDTSSHASFADYPNKSTLEPGYLFSHQQVIEQLPPGTTVHYRVQSVGRTGLATISADDTIVTPASGTRPTPINGLLALAVPTLSLPSVGTSQLDTAWGTHRTRICATAGIRNTYATKAAWARDGGRLYLFSSAGGVYPGHVHDGAAPYAHLGTFSQDVDATLDPSDSDIAFGIVLQNTLRRRRLSTGAVVQSWTISGYTNVRIGDSEDGGISDDGRYVCLQARTGSQERVLVFDAQTGSVITAVNVPSRPNNSRMSQDGAYVVIVFTPTGSSGWGAGTYVMNRDGTNQRRIHTSNTHGDTVAAASGSSWYVAPFNSKVRAWRLSDLSEVDVWPAGHGAMPYCHISGRSGGYPDWVTVSTYYDQGLVKGNDQTVSVNILSPGQTIVWGHQRAASDINGSPYAGQPWSVPNWDLTKVTLGSDNGASSVYPWVYEL